jgi:hypothetical protein
MEYCEARRPRKRMLLQYLLCTCFPSELVAKCLSKSMLFFYLLCVKTKSARNIGTRYHNWSRYCAVSRKFAPSIIDDVVGCFKFTKYLQSYCGPGIDSASNINWYQESSCEVKSVSRMHRNCGILDVSQPKGRNLLSSIFICVKYYPCAVPTCSALTPQCIFARKNFIQRFLIFLTNI